MILPTIAAMFFQDPAGLQPLELVGSIIVVARRCLSSDEVLLRV